MVLWLPKEAQVSDEQLRDAERAWRANPLDPQKRNAYLAQRLRSGLGVGLDLLEGPRPSVQFTAPRDCKVYWRGQGWRQRERAGLKERANARAILALAFLHHLVIGKNIPLGEAVDWLVQVAPAGVIEFVPKTDPMVRRMLAQREDIFNDYDIETFRQMLSSISRVQKEMTLSETGRTLFIYER